MATSNGKYVSDDPAVVQYARHVNPSFVKLLGVYGYGRLFTRARDVWVWDSDERRYLDFLAGFGAVNLGHNPPKLIERMQRFLAEDAFNLCHIGPAPQAAALAAKLAELAAPLTVSMFSSSGGEAVEAGLKLARAATKRHGFLYCVGGFHGTNLGSLSVMGSDRLRQPFEPLLEHCTAIPFGDPGALHKELGKRSYAAFLVEPIQGEGGVVFPPSGYLALAQAWCKQFGTLLVLDEVQTGLGRAGTMFAYQAEGFVPDVLVLGKALGGSLVPISATLTTPELHARAYGTMTRFDLHSSTFGGNALACTAALETIRILEDDRLLANSQARGAELLAKLRQRLTGHPLVHAVNGRGLFVGIELGPAGDGWISQVAPWLGEEIARGILGQWLAVRLLEAGIIAQPASQKWNVFRLEPPLTVQSEQIDSVVDALGGILDEYRVLPALFKDVGQRLGRQFVAGWKF
jgi:putrescine aminotransferase